MSSRNSLLTLSFSSSDSSEIALIVSSAYFSNVLILCRWYSCLLFPER